MTNAVVRFRLTTPISIAAIKEDLKHVHDSKYVLGPEVEENIHRAVVHEEKGELSKAANYYAEASRSRSLGYLRMGYGGDWLEGGNDATHILGLKLYVKAAELSEQIGDHRSASYYYSSANAYAYNPIFYSVYFELKQKSRENDEKANPITQQEVREAVSKTARRSGVIKRLAESLHRH